MSKTEPSEAAGLGKTAALAALELLAAKPGLVDSIGDIAEAMHAFAKRAVEAEREACAAICDELALDAQEHAKGPHEAGTMGPDTYFRGIAAHARDLAAAIRERGER